MTFRLWPYGGIALFVVAASCATIGYKAVKAPFGKRCLYAPIFVDNTNGQVAHELYDALNQRIYRRAPGLFSYDYAEGCAVIDGTVLSIAEKSEGAFSEISIKISALVKDKAGNERAVGVLSRSQRFQDNRERAIVHLCFGLADDLLDVVSALDIESEAKNPAVQ